MDRCALFVDAGYLLADGAMAVHGIRSRDAVSWDYAGLLEMLGNLALERTRLPLLRCYWYEATVEGRRGPEHDGLADLPGLKLRLGRIRPGRREGTDLMIYRDLTTLARERGICDAVLVSGDEDMTQAVADVQDLGVRVTGIHIVVDGNWTIPRALRQECDDLIEIGSSQLRPYVNLIRGVDTSSPPLSNGQATSSTRAHLSIPSPGRHAPPTSPGAQHISPRTSGSHRMPTDPSGPPLSPGPPSTPQHVSDSASGPHHMPDPASGSHRLPDHASGPHRLPDHASGPHRLPDHASGPHRMPGPMPDPMPGSHRLPELRPGHPSGPTYISHPEPGGYGQQMPRQESGGAHTLADAVKAAHSEGREFGDSVARDAPALWLEAVLARKPRMPSDLEARLLQGSSLPIDFLLHDEVRHALRRGFWDALEQSRRG